MIAPNAHESFARELLLLGAAISGLVVLSVVAAIVVSIVWSREITPPPGYSGDPKRGHELIATYGCESCHEIPGVAPAGLVGPPLTRIGRRAYIAGRVPNFEITMTLWIENPQQIKPGTAMPNLGVTRRDARDIAAYLATLR